MLTIEVVGEFLGLDEDTKLFNYFRCHYAYFFPNLRLVHLAPPSAGRRQTCGRGQGVSLAGALSESPHDPGFALADSFLCRRACSSGPTAVGVLRERPPSVRHPPQADLLRLQGTREGLLPSCRYPFVARSGQRPRALGPLRTHRAYLHSARRGSQLPLAPDRRRVGRVGR